MEVDGSGVATDEIQGESQHQSGSSKGNPERTLRSARRVLVINLPYELDWFELKDFFKQIDPKADDGNGTQGFVDVFNHPVTRKSLGAGLVEFRTVDEMKRALELNGQNFKGRNVKIMHDPENFHLRKFADRNGLDYRMDSKYRPRFVEKGRGGDRNDRDSARDRHRDSHRRDGPPPSGPRGPPPGPPPPNFGGPPPPPADPFGKPLINDLTDLLESTVFFSNLPWRTRREECMQMFETCGTVNHLNMMHEDDDHDDERKRGKFRGMGLCEFTRARDAHRALIMIHNSRLDDREIAVRLAKELRPLPRGLSDLGRPLPEQQCADMARAEYIDPFHPTKLFCANVAFEVDEKTVRDVFELVGDVYECRLLKRDGKSKGIAVIQVASGVDAVQCINVLHDAQIDGRQLKVRLDREDAAGGRGPPPAEPVPGQHVPFPRDAPPPPRREERYDYGYDSRRREELPPPQVPKEYRGGPPRDEYGFGGPPGVTSGNSSYDRRDDRRAKESTPPRDKDAKVKELADMLGLNSDTIAALKLLQGNNQQPSKNEPAAVAPPPKREYNSNNNSRNDPRRDNSRDQQQRRNNQQWNNNNTSGNRYRERSPVRNQRNNNGFSNQQAKGNNNQGNNNYGYGSNTGGGGASNGGYGSNQNGGSYDKNMMMNYGGNSSSGGYGQASYGNNNSGQNRNNNNRGSSQSGYEKNSNNQGGYAQTRFDDQTASATAQSNQQQQPAKQQSSTSTSSWTPVTKDTVYVRNLPETMNESRLRQMLSANGVISFMDFPLKHDHKPVGYAYVRFDGANSLECTNRAIAQFDNYVVDGCKLEVGLY